MLAKLHTFSLLGIDAVPVEVEVDVSPTSVPKTILVGLPEAAVRESRHRVDRAMVNSLSRYNEDYADVRGQEMAKRALIIAAAGSHNLLMLGPPGSGKTVYIPRQRTDDPAAALSAWPSISGTPTFGRCWLPIVAGLVSGAGTGLEGNNTVLKTAPNGR